MKTNDTGRPERQTKSAARAVGAMIILIAQAEGIADDFTIVVCGGDEETALAHRLYKERTIDGYVSLTDLPDGGVEIMSLARTRELDGRLADVCETVHGKLVTLYQPAKWDTWTSGGIA